MSDDRNGEWKWWGHSQYFEQHQNYFESQCLDWAQGLVGGNYRGCVPWEGGSIYDMTAHTFWRKCDQDQICPVGTKYEFPVEEFAESFEEVRMDNLPEMYDPHRKLNDHTATIVIFTCIVWTLILFILISIILSACKEKALFVFRELDKPFVTGGSHKKVVGGIIMLFFIMVNIIVSLGFFINYFLFNSNTVFSETKNPFLNRVYDTSYLFNVSIYMSRFIESEEPFNATIDNFQNIKHKPTPNLWERNAFQTTSRYFSKVKHQNSNFNCKKIELSNGTDQYNLSLMIKDVQDTAPKDAFVRFKLNSEYSQVVHFFKWEYWNIWRFYGNIPISYSKVSGFVTPHMTHKSNKNITAAFKGPESTKIFFKLTPTHYGNEIESQSFEGYQVFVDEYQRGSVVTKRNMANQINELGEPFAGFDLELVSTVGDTIYHIQVQRVKSIIETIAYIFGFAAGFIIVSHILKNVLAKEEYFRGLDRECNTLFGSLDPSQSVFAYPNPPEPTQDVELKPFDSTRERQRFTDEDEIAKSDD